jgi:hypothetical protein
MYAAACRTELARRGIEAARYDWERVARPNQLPPLVIGGDGYSSLVEASVKLELALNGLELRSNRESGDSPWLLLPLQMPETLWLRVRAVFSRCFRREKSPDTSPPLDELSGPTAHWQPCSRPMSLNDYVVRNMMARGAMSLVPGVIQKPGTCSCLASDLASIRVWSLHYNNSSTVSGACLPPCTG